MIEISYEQAAVIAFLVLVTALLFRWWGEVVASKQLWREYHNFLSPIRNHCDSNLRVMCGEKNWDDFRAKMVKSLELENSECGPDCDLTLKHHLPLLKMIRRQLQVMTLLSPLVEPLALDELYFDENKELRRR